MVDKFCIKYDLSLEINGKECFAIVEVENDKEKIRWGEVEYIRMVVRNDTKG